MNKEKKDLQQKVIELEDRQRRDNLVIEGISDSERESKKECESKARNFMRNDLKINGANQLVLGRVHRMGRYNANKCRPTIVKFDRFKERERVWNKRKAAPEGTRLKENFSKETEKSRSKLFPIMFAARKKNYFAKVDGNKLIIRNTAGVDITCTVDTLNKLPADLNPATLFTPTKDNVTLFYTVNSPHSNFHKCEFVEGDKVYSCVEQYYVYSNAVSANEPQVAEQVYKATDPAYIKSLGKDLSVEMDTKKEHLKKGMLLKYSQNPDLLALLKSTNDNRLGEANPFDKYWGTGIRMTHEDAFNTSKWADNWCGKLLEEVRDEL